MTGRINQCHGTTWQPGSESRSARVRNHASQSDDSYASLPDGEGPGVRFFLGGLVGGAVASLSTTSEPHQIESIEDQQDATRSKGTQLTDCQRFPHSEWGFLACRLCRAGCSGDLLIYRTGVVTFTNQVHGGALSLKSHSCCSPVGLGQTRSRVSAVQNSRISRNRYFRLAASRPSGTTSAGDPSGVESQSWWSVDVGESCWSFVVTYPANKASKAVRLCVEPN